MHKLVFSTHDGIVEIQSTFDISNSVISKCPVISNNIVQTELLFLYSFQLLFLKPLISQSQFPWARKFTSHRRRKRGAGGGGQVPQ